MDEKGSRPGVLGRAEHRTLGSGQMDRQQVINHSLGRSTADHLRVPREPCEETGPREAGLVVTRWGGNAWLLKNDGID